MRDNTSDNWDIRDAEKQVREAARALQDRVGKLRRACELTRTPCGAPALLKQFGFAEVPVERVNLGASIRPEMTPGQAVRAMFGGGAK